MLKLRDIKKTYIVDKKHFPALKNINLTFPDKGFISILGPSGCGKTTLLNLIGGLDQYTSGDLIINNKSTKKFTDRDWDAYRNKRVGFVFQNYNLVPHLTVLGNVEISMTLTGMSKKARQKKAIAALKRVGLKDTIKKKPNQLSGGQMQRVAIARSLVNNPEIILADEPTGALDSVTSVQVMEILKEVSQDRLVIMVTHNVELAKQYSTRIIRLKDGLVVGDSSPLRSTKKKETQELAQEKNKHTHMSFFTALGSSAKSLLTKKGRTIMTTVAASFGIIGVALVLAMSNGFQGYVNRVEAETASSVPITISPFVTTSIKQIDLPPAWPKDQEIIPYDEDLSKLVVVHHNRLTKEYADYTKGLLKEPTNYASSVLENHEYLDFNIFTERENPALPDKKEVIKVDQFQSAGAGGAILSGVTNLPSTIFHELYGGKDYINSLYDVIEGTYPKDYNPDTNEAELCVVCDRYNRIPMSTLYALGLSSSKETQEGQKISFDKIIGHEYKAYKPSDMETAIEDAVQKKEPGGKAYISTHLNENTYAEYDPHNNTFVSGKGKDITQYRNIDADDAVDARKLLYSNNDGTKDYHPIKLKISGIIRPKRTTLVNLMPGSVCYGTALKDHFLSLTSEYQKFSEIAKNNYAIDIATLDSEVQKTVQGLLSLGYASAINYQNTGTLYSVLDDNSILTSMFAFYDIFTEKFYPESTEIVPPSEQQFSNHYLQSNYRFASEFRKDIEFKEIEIPYQGKIYPGLVPVPDTFDDLTDVLTYASGYSTITSVLIFPKTLSDKGRIFKYLDKYNKDLPETQQILYSDLAGSLTDALGTMIDVISVVLIVFSSVSLLVSCVMTGVITYTSVLERTKEIGILRAIGARKKDVGRLFEAESVIIGGVAGIIGVLVTFIAEWPISLIINSNFPEQNIGMICNLSPIHALILVAISILLTFVSGFIPARKAADKDPVVALRTE